MWKFKKQKTHNAQVISGIGPPAPTLEQETAIKHGTDSEIRVEVASMCSVVMKVLFPDCVFHEEGYYVGDNMLVSPDGSLRLTCSLPASEPNKGTPKGVAFQLTGVRD